MTKDWSYKTERNELYMRLVGSCGVRNQMTKLCEELSELIQATCKLNGHVNIGKREQTFDNFLNEITDVNIMLEQIQYMLDVQYLSTLSKDEIKNKLEMKRSNTLDRLLKRLESGELDQ